MAVYDLKIDMSLPDTTTSQVWSRNFFFFFLGGVLSDTLTKRTTPHKIFYKIGSNHDVMVNEMVLKIYWVWSHACDGVKLGSA